ncbi:hypothetical protein F0562_000521 [Nyssa sinensis]|uniref:NB-ARC domain-containing protein n=1 Tax=Nyssa sinensis TaxID=561372 RepID=A0A5J5C4J2_9ASTE|nr:hypothetical protein F0562_000521 [Nyssa sinensis]
MAESVVSFAVQRVSDLFINEKIFLYGVSDQVEGLRSELLRIQCFLKDADERQDESEIKNLVEEIQKTAYDVEDVIEILIVKVASSRRRRSGGSLQMYGIKAITLGEGSRSGAFETQLQLSESYSHAVEEDFVGLGGDVKELVAKLVNEDENLRVISIVGMGGMGKTTLAQKVYNHNDVRRHFDSFAWVCISQQWQTRDVLQEILTKLIPKERWPIERMELEELFKKLYDVQIQKKCLIVLDDVWSEEAWNSLRSAFSNTQTATKILITSRNKSVGSYVDPRGMHELRFLNSEESWELFHNKAFRGNDRG